jgi:hypothetical protein
MALADVLDSPANNTKHDTIVKHYKRAHDKLGTRWLPRQQQQASPLHSVPAACTPLVWGQRRAPRGLLDLSLIRLAFIGIRLASAVS